MSIQDECVQKYSELKHLKLTGQVLGIPWQTVYVHLKNAGVSVTGDKARYGSVSDRLACCAEKMFAKSVPEAQDNNGLRFQATVDFEISGFLIDVKAAMLKKQRVEKSGKKTGARWAFCISKQKDVSDFFVLYALSGESGEPFINHIFLLPKEIATTKTTISIPQNLKSKWADYEIQEHELRSFFNALPSKKAA